MKFFLANTSRHDQGFNYRLPEDTKPIHRHIRIGRQEMLGDKLSTPDIDALIAQVATYGGLRASDYESEAGGKVITFLYDIDKQVSGRDIERAMRHNTGQLVLQGKKAREEAAIATSAAMENMTPGLINKVEMTVQQETPAAPGESQVAEGVIVQDADRAQRSEVTATKSRRGKR